MNQTEKSKLKRTPQRGHYDWKTIASILEHASLCHLAVVHQGSPVVMPTLFGLRDKDIYVHGSAASRLLKTIDQGIDLCFTVSLVDGLVLARSGFHHSINYRSVVLFGKGVLVEGEEKLEGLKIISDQSIPHRWDEVRSPSELEMKATTVIKLQVDEGSAKIRTGPPIDDEEDYDLDIWAGVVPVKQVFGEPIPDEKLKQGISVSPSVRRLCKL